MRPWIFRKNKSSDNVNLSIYYRARVGETLIAPTKLSLTLSNSTLYFFSLHLCVAANEGKGEVSRNCVLRCAISLGKSLCVAAGELCSWDGGWALGCQRNKAVFKLSSAERIQFSGVFREPDCWGWNTLHQPPKLPAMDTCRKQNWALPELKLKGKIHYLKSPVWK